MTAREIERMAAGYPMPETVSVEIASAVDPAWYARPAFCDDLGTVHLLAERYTDPVAAAERALERCEDEEIDIARTYGYCVHPRGGDYTPVLAADGTVRPEWREEIYG